MTFNNEEFDALEKRVYEDSDALAQAKSVKKEIEDAMGKLHRAEITCGSIPSEIDLNIDMLRKVKDISIDSLSNYVQEHITDVNLYVDVKHIGHVSKFNWDLEEFKKTADIMRITITPEWSNGKEVDHKYACAMLAVCKYTENSKIYDDSFFQQNRLTKRKIVGRELPPNRLCTANEIRLKDNVRMNFSLAGKEELLVHAQDWRVGIALESIKDLSRWGLTVKVPEKYK